MRSKYWLFILVSMIVLLTGCPFRNKLPVWDTIPNLIKSIGETVSFSLSTYCHDPEGKPLTFGIVSGPGTLTSDVYTWTLSDPTGDVAVIVSANDGNDESTATFVITVNTPPATPSNPSPSDNSVDQSFPYLTLSWSGGDPDGEEVKYDLYFGTSANPPLHSEDLTSTSFDKPFLQSYTTYYWKVVAKDKGGSVSSPVWQFRTATYTLVNEDFESRSLGIPDLPWATYLSSGATGEITARGKPGQALTFVDLVQSNYAKIARCDLNQISEGHVQFDFRVSANGCFGFREATNSLTYVYIGDSDSGYGIYSYNPETHVFTKMMPISADTWYNVTIYFNLNTGFFRVYVDRTIMRTEYFSGSFTFTSFEFTVFSDSTCKYVDIDNVIIAVYDSGYSASSIELSDEVSNASSESQ
ncbi:MAG: fibronectin type III domain-containing protein [Kosmotogaceae bacterium]|nr:fibronectin type III domain-containing protein [Kosmotogaceae bacterium]